MCLLRYVHRHNISCYQYTGSDQPPMFILHVHLFASILSPLSIEMLNKKNGAFIYFVFFTLRTRLTFYTALVANMSYHSGTIHFATLIYSFIIQEAIRRLKCFDRLITTNPAQSESIRMQLARTIQLVTYNKGRTIIKQGHNPMSIYFIISGSVAIYKTDTAEDTGETGYTRICLYNHFS